MSDSVDGRRRVEELARQAEAIVEALEVRAGDGRWAMTAFSRYRVCELLNIPPYGAFRGSLEGDPAELLDEAAQCADKLEVPVEDLSWRLAVGDALRSAASDIRAVRDARDL